MRSYRLFLHLLGALVLPLSCQSEIAFIESSIQSSQADASASQGNVYLIFSSSAGSSSIDLEASGKWTASYENERARDWCLLSSSKGNRGTATISVSVKENTDYDERSVSINFVCGSMIRTVIVTQKQKDALLLSSCRQDIGKDGGNFTIEVDANVSFEYSISKGAETWIKAVETRGLSKSVLVFNVSANDYLSREGDIVFSSSSGTEVVKVYQEGEAPTLILGRNLYEFTPEGGTLSVEVSSNLPLDIVIPPGCDWIAPLVTRTVTDRTHIFSVGRNHGRFDRTGWIVFKNEQMSCSDTVTVLQSFQPILLTCDTLKASSRGWTLSFDTVGSEAGEYRLSFTDSWLSFSGHEKLPEGTRLFVNVEPQSGSASPRDSRILVYYKDYAEPDTVHIHQYGSLPSFSFTTTKRTVTVPEVEGDQQLGFVFWGDGAYDAWQPGLSHSFETAGEKTVCVEILKKKRVGVTGLEDRMSINFKELRE